MNSTPGILRTFDLDLVALEANFIHARDRPQFSVGVDLLRVLFQQHHLEHDIDRRLSLPASSARKFRMFCARLFECCADPIFLVSLLRRAVEGENHVIQTAIQQHIGALVVEQRRIGRHACPNARIARDANHLENLRMDHRLADAVRPDEFDVVLAVLDDLSVQLQVHVLVVECVDMPRTHRTVEIALRRAFERDLDRAALRTALCRK